jgi:hypothetical protein
MFIEVHMPETIQMNLNVRPKTRERLEEIARQTYRGMGNTLDWLVGEAWQRLIQQKLIIQSSKDQQEVSGNAVVS